MQIGSDKMQRARSPSQLLLGIVLVLASSANADTLQGKVVRIADGDSLTLLVDRQEIRVRLVEIDAPERRQAFGNRSRQSLTELCAGKSARVAWTERDRYGRVLGRVWCSGVDANAEQVRRGMAWVFDRYVTDRGLYKVQDAARAARVGLWVDSAPTPPWEWRQAKNAGEIRDR